MNIKKATSLILIGSTLSFTALPSWTLAANNSGDSPEAQLMESALIAQGSSSGQTEMKQKIALSVQQYLQDSKSESDAERASNLEQAWVNFQIMTPAQAHEEAMEISQASSQSKNVSDMINSTAEVLENTKGAQFDGCVASGISAAVFGGGGVVVEIVGAVKADAATDKGTTRFPDGVPTSAAAAPLEAAGIAAMGVGFAILIVALNSRDICND